MSGFTISITAGKDKASSSVQVEGIVQHIITDDERETFGLSDSQLKQAVGTYFGKRPNDAYLHGPTPWGDLYKKNDWDQTETVLVASSAEILDLTSDAVALKTQIFQNDSSINADFDVSITDQVTNTSTSSWNTGGTLTVAQKIKYEIGFLGTGGGGEDELSYSQTWGIGGSQSKTTTFGSSSSVKVTLKPHQSIKAILSASRGVMKARVRYTARLIGTTAVNYNPVFRDHHFWDFPIGSVMSNSDISNSIESIEDIEVGYFSNGKIVIQDNNTDEEMDARYL